MPNQSRLIVAVGNPEMLMTLSECLGSTGTKKVVFCNSNKELGAALDSSQECVSVYVLTDFSLPDIRGAEMHGVILARRKDVYIMNVLHIPGPKDK